MTSFARRLNLALARLAASRPRSAGLGVGLLVALLALAAFLPAFTSLPPVDRDEARFAQASKQMAETGDLVDIRFQDRPRYKKPVGIYWLQSAAVEASGGLQTLQIWHYRLPSLLAAVLAAVLTASIAAGFGGATAGLAAGIPMAGMFLLGVEAHLATTDAVLLLTVLAAQWVLAPLYRVAREQGFAPPPPLGWGRVALFWGAVAFGTLVKGPIGPGVVALTVLALALGHRRWRWLGALRPKAGLVLFAALVLPWFLAITWRSGLGFWQAAVGHDLLGKVAEAQESHGAPPGSYLAALWLTFQPAAIALGLTLPAIWAARRRPGVTFAMAWAIPGWLIFEAASTKLVHYVLPFYPALALAMALVWAESAARPLAGARRVWFYVLAVLPVLMLAVAGGYVISMGGRPVLPLVLGLAAVAAGLGLAHAALRAGLPLAALVGLWLTGAGVTGGILSSVAATPALWPAKAIVALLPVEPSCRRITLYESGYGEPSLVFLAPGPVVSLAPAQAAAKLAKDRCSAAVVPDAKATAMLGAKRLGTVTGLDLGTGRPVDLAVFGPGRK
ncbi:hypothetical protein U879_19690 [Defluviimonas sp. 20V17]|uniref:4-amino-4-deoxy-L-arabinose transferase n=1 Tax=Allgaiera indica TaxID=765699 RepID=A0AAN4USS1_9RHOB|nr:glycosyltransferase family 39 protein [Allgaiera indica]KDB01976.1 hypothetical protein U879_19690 [Defluviimonas sp. 20V17]GHE03331.1 glycosyl transferase [Allgaiera indica]SDX23504.1 4-amino-4-deoxy-L-arabinose transferase [Allgaiera indica]